MESPAELNQQMIFAIRALLKPVRDSRISLPMFLNFATPHLLRSPEEFMAGKTEDTMIVSIFFVFAVYFVLQVLVLI